MDEVYALYKGVSQNAHQAVSATAVILTLLVVKSQRTDHIVTPP